MDDNTRVFSDEMKREVLETFVFKTTTKKPILLFHVALYYRLVSLQSTR